MADQEKIVIAVQVDTQEVARKLTEATKNVEELKQSNKDLQKEQASLAKQIKETGDATGELNAKMVENTKKMAANSAEIEANNRVVKSNTALLQLQTLDRIDSNATLDEQRQLLNAAQKAFSSMTAEQKAAAGGAEQLSERIKDLSDRVKKQEAALGDNRRNVGNYTESILEADKELGGFGGSLTALIMPIKNATLGLKAMSATPIIAILSALVTIIMKLHERFKQNAAAMEQLNEVFGVFSGAANVVNVIIDKIAEGLGWLAQKTLELAEKIGMLNNSMKAGRDIAREDLAIQKAQQEAALKTAEDQKKIAELKANAAETDKYTNKERLEMLQKAADLEEGITQRQYDLAKREYELQVKRNAQSASSMDDLKKENDLKIAMIKAETDLFNKRKELNGQMASLRAAEQAAIQKAAEERNKITREAAIQAMEDARLLAAAQLASLDAMHQDIIEKNREMLESLDEEEEENVPTVEEMARNTFGLDQAGVDYFKSLLDEGVEYSNAKTMAIADQTKRMVQAWSASFGSLSSTFSEMSTFLGQYSEESEEAAAAQKAFTLAGILMNQAQSISQGALAISEGVASAAAIPFPANIPAIATVVATVTSLITGVASSIAQAKQLFADAESAGKFAQGGIVPGTSYSGDKLTANVNSREMILPLPEQKVLFDALSSAADGNMQLGFDYELMAAAVAALPAPNLVLTELAQEQDKIVTINEIASV